MGKREFTAEQKSAIETRNKSLLVSAAAGSGKTATLTERIIQSLTDSKCPEDITHMLIVTFTNAAVAELRERITAALKAKLVEEPDNKHLEHQLYMLPSARISTIDAFCNDILKNNTEKFGISPRYRIADPIEADILARSTLSALIDAAYRGEIAEVVTPKRFEELAITLTGVKNESSLEDVIRMLCERSKSHVDGVKLFGKFAKRLAMSEDKPIESNPYGEYAMRRTREAASHYLEVISILSEKYMLSDDKYADAVNSDKLLLVRIKNADTYSKMQSALRSDITNLPTIKGDKTEFQEHYSELRSAMKEALIKKCADRYFTYTEEEWKNHLHDQRAFLTDLATFIEKFDEVYFAEKKSRSMLEYSDVERLTHLSLRKESGEPSELALALREEFSSIYIDEYQDVNALQNEIFLAISKPNNRFTVGDIKQSIYGFRGACPDIFADMKNTYPPIEEAKYSSTASIFMSKNFRCDEGIIDFVNSIFDKMFSLTADSIGYVSEDRLTFSKIYESESKPPYRYPEVHLFSKADFVPDVHGKDFVYADLAPEWTAKKIKELLDSEQLNSGKPIRPSDIAIILRKDHGRISKYIRALESLGIKAKAPENKNFFLNPDIQLMLCLLNSIDNPMRDIYLAGLMLSPLFNFTPDELYSVGKEHRRSLWESVKAFSESNPDNTKFSTFIKRLNRYRAISEGMKVDELIQRLYSETGILALAAKGGSKENLLLLYNYARKFESSSFEGLYSFINYVNTVIESGASFQSNKDGEEEDAVSILTVHKSKGLEYPVVFLADAATSLISQNERKTKIAYSDNYGIAAKLRIPDGLALVESPIYNVIIDSNIERCIEEELRVYYVALTRAREILFIVGTPDTQSKENFLSDVMLKRIYTSSYSLKEMKTFVDILYSVDTNAKISWSEDEKEEKKPQIPENLLSLPQKESENESEQPKDADEEAEKRRLDSIPVSTNQPPDKALSEQNSLSAQPPNTASEDAEKNHVYTSLIDRFSFEYPKKLLTELPEKMSISKLSPSVLDGGDEEIRLSFDFIQKEENIRPTLPEFMSGGREKESARRGIATHNFLQFFDLSRLSKNDPDEELSELVKGDFISEENAKKVRIREIELFKKSKLFSEMKEAKKLYREFRFSVKLPASLFTQNPEKKKLLMDETILLQGVIDCIIVDRFGDIHLIDYKTDRLTKEELSDRKSAEKKLSEKHSLQLSYYARAVREIFGKSPITLRVYSLPLGDTVDITPII